MMADKENRSNWSRPEQHHWAEQEWRKFVTPDSAPDLKHWTPGTTLDEVKQTNHIAKPMRRLAQRITHAMLLPFLDQRRPHWQADSYPQLISPEIVSVLARELAI
jgi:hypothetical protein